MGTGARYRTVSSPVYAATPASGQDPGGDVVEQRRHHPPVGPSRRPLEGGAQHRGDHHLVALVGEFALGRQRVGGAAHRPVGHRVVPGAQGLVDAGPRRSGARSGRPAGRPGRAGRRSASSAWPPGPARPLGPSRSSSASWATNASLRRRRAPAASSRGSSVTPATYRTGRTGAGRRPLRSRVAPVVSPRGRRGRRGRRAGRPPRRSPARPWAGGATRRGRGGCCPGPSTPSARSWASGNRSASQPRNGMVPPSPSRAGGLAEAASRGPVERLVQPRARTAGPPTRRRPAPASHVTSAPYGGSVGEGPGQGGGRPPRRRRWAAAGRPACSEVEGRSTAPASTGRRQPVGADHGHRAAPGPAQRLVDRGGALQREAWAPSGTAAVAARPRPAPAPPPRRRPPPTAAGRRTSSGSTEVAGGRVLDAVEQQPGDAERRGDDRRRPRRCGRRGRAPARSGCRPARPAARW